MRLQPELGWETATSLCLWSAVQPWPSEAEHRVDAVACNFTSRRLERGRGRLAGFGGRNDGLRVRDGGRSGRGGTGCGDRRGGGPGLRSQLLQISEITRLFGARLNGGKRQMLLVLHRRGDAVQLPDQLLELFRAAQVQLAIPEEPDRQHEDNRQADGQRGQYDGEKQGGEGRQGFGHGTSKSSLLKAEYRRQRVETTKPG